MLGQTIINKIARKKLSIIIILSLFTYLCFYTITNSIAITQVNFISKPPILTPHYFNYILNAGKSVCDGKNIFLFIFIFSSPHNYIERSNIRETWYKDFTFVEFIFIFIYLKGKAYK